MSKATLLQGDCMELMSRIPDGGMAKTTGTHKLQVHHILPAG